jgi:hypothetical protein
VQGFPDRRQQARMIGLWGACVALAVVVGLRGIRESSDPAHAGADPAGQVLAIGWLAAQAEYDVAEPASRNV